MYSVRLKTITQLQSTVIVPPSASATATEVTHHISQDPVEHNQPELKNYSTFVSFVVLRSSSYTLTLKYQLRLARSLLVLEIASLY